VFDAQMRRVQTEDSRSLPHGTLLRRPSLRNVHTDARLGASLFKKTLSFDEFALDVLTEDGDDDSNSIVVHIERVSDLPDFDWFILGGKIDPYVCVSHGMNRSFSKVHVRGGTDVLLDFTTQFPASRQNSKKLIIEVFDSNKLKAPQLCGYVGISPWSYRSSPLVHKKLGLNRPGIGGRLKPAGEIVCSVAHLPYDHLSRSFPVPTLRLVLKAHKHIGALQTLVDGTPFQPFLTYQLTLWNVLEVMGVNPQHWNVEYTNAQKIFGKKMSSKAVRAAIRIQHSQLYQTTKEHKFICGAHSFVECLDFSHLYIQIGDEISSQMCRFTYVILEDYTMHFSATSAETAKDFLSKHALHSNCSENVVYAGEFFLEASNIPTLVFDNNSGTYAPSKDLLLSLQQLLEINFGKDIPIVTLDRSDPRLKQWRTENGIK